MSFDVEKYGSWSNQSDATCYEHAAMAVKSISGNILKLDASAGVGCKAENGGAPGSCFIYCNNAVNQSV